MSAILHWSSCQADFLSSDSENSDFENSDFDDHDEEEIDDTIVRQTKDSEENEQSKRWNIGEALNMLKANHGDLDTTVNQIIQEATHDSLNQLKTRNQKTKSQGV